MIAAPGISLDLKALGTDAVLASVPQGSIDPSAPVLDAAFGKLLSGLTVPPVEAGALAVIEDVPAENAGETAEGEKSLDAVEGIALALPEFALAQIVPPLGTAPAKLPEPIESGDKNTSIAVALPGQPKRDVASLALPVGAQTFVQDGDLAKPAEPLPVDDMLAPAPRIEVAAGTVLRDVLKLKLDASDKAAPGPALSKAAFVPVIDAGLTAARPTAEQVLTQSAKAEPPTLNTAFASAPTAFAVQFDPSMTPPAFVSSTTTEPFLVAGSGNSDLSGKLGDQAIQTRLDIANESEWMDRVARDIAQFGGKDGSLKFQLNPENLGSLHVEIAHGADGVSLRFGTETESARNVLADAQHRLANEARAQGVRIAETHIDFGNHNNGSGNKAPQTQPQIITQGQAQGAEPAEKQRSKPLERFA